MIVVRFHLAVIRIEPILAMMGQSKVCTLTMAGLDAEKTDRVVMSYGKFSRALTADVVVADSIRKCLSPKKSNGGASFRLY